MARPRKVRTKGVAERMAAELASLPEDMQDGERRRRIEAVLFAAPRPLRIEEIARAVEPGTDVRAILARIQAECAGRGWQLVEAPTGWVYRTRAEYGDAVRLVLEPEVEATPLTRAEIEVLMIIAYYQPVTRAQIAIVRDTKEVRSEWLTRFLDLGWIGFGPKLSTAGNPQTYVTTERFLDHFGLASLNDLPDHEKLSATGLLSKDDRAGDMIRESMAAMLRSGEGATEAAPSAESA